MQFERGWTDPPDLRLRRRAGWPVKGELGNGWRLVWGTNRELNTSTILCVINTWISNTGNTLVSPGCKNSSFYLDEFSLWLFGKHTCLWDFTLHIFWKYNNGNGIINIYSWRKIIAFQANKANMNKWALWLKMRLEYCYHPGGASKTENIPAPLPGMIDFISSPVILWAVTRRRREERGMEGLRPRLQRRDAEGTWRKESEKEGERRTR